MLSTAAYFYIPRNKILGPVGQCGYLATTVLILYNQVLLQINKIRNSVYFRTNQTPHCTSGRKLQQINHIPSPKNVNHHADDNSVSPSTNPVSWQLKLHTWPPEEMLIMQESAMDNDNEFNTIIPLRQGRLFSKECNCSNKCESLKALLQRYQHCYY